MRLRMSRRSLAALAAVYFIWGGSYPAIAVLVRTTQPLVGTGFRFLAAAVVLGGWIAYRSGGRAMWPSSREALGALVVGPMILANFGIVAVVERHIAPGVVAIVVSSIPMWTVVLRATLGEAPRPVTAIAMLGGLAAVAILSVSQWTGEKSLGWIGLILGGCFLNAAGTVLSQRVYGAMARPRVPVMEMLAGGLLFVGLGVVLEGGKVNVHGWSHPAAILAFAYLVVPASVVGYSAYRWLADHESPTIAATYAYVNPLVALALSVVLLGDAVSVGVGVSFVLMVASVAAIVSFDRRRAPIEQVGT